MTIESLQVEVAALERLPETGALDEAEVGLDSWWKVCSHHATCYVTCQYTINT